MTDTQAYLPPSALPVTQKHWQPETRHYAYHSRPAHPDRNLSHHALGGGEVDRFACPTVNHIAIKHIDTYGQQEES